ncbi:AAA family ATPase [Chloroflexota bacterium]
MIVITISRQLGSHGEEIATGLAETLDLRVVDAAAINCAAQEAGVPENALAEFEREGEQSLANRVLGALRTMPNLHSLSSLGMPATGPGEMPYTELPGMTIPFTGLFSPTVAPISSSLESYVRMVGMVIRGLAHESNVLIVGRGGQVLLKSHPQALHVQVVAPLAHRTQVLMSRLDLSKRAAQNRLRANDRSRSDYLRRYHGADWLDSTLYHLVINSGRVSVSEAVALTVAAQRALIPQPADGDDDE